MRTLFIILFFLLLPLSGPFVGSAHAEPQSKEILKLPALTVATRSNDSKLDLIIKGPSAMKAEIFEVENPRRLVIDLPVTVSKLNRTVASPNQNLITAIRFGAHPGKVRIVLDFASGIVLHTSHKTAGRVTLTLETTPTKELSATPIPLITPPSQPTLTPTVIPSATQLQAETPRATPTVIQTTVSPLVSITPEPSVTPLATGTLAPLPTETPHPTPTFTPEPSPTTMPTATETPAATPTVAPAIETPLISPVAVGCRLSGIEFFLENAESFVRLTLSERTQFKLVREKERRYKIMIPDCTVATPGLSLPQFPPNDVVGFTLVRIQQVDSKIEIDIGLDDGMKANAVNKDAAILIKASPAGF